MRVGRKTTKASKLTEESQIWSVTKAERDSSNHSQSDLQEIDFSFLFVTCNFIQCVMFFTTVFPRRISKTPSGVIDSWPAGINKDSSCVWQHGPSGPWQFRTGPVWSIENTPWMSASGMVISLGKQPVGTAQSKKLKIYLWEAITGIKLDVNSGKALKC